jgi:hypothetical protein
MISLSNPDGLINHLDTQGNDWSHPSRGGNPSSRLNNGSGGLLDRNPEHFIGADGKPVDFDSNDYGDGGKRTAAKARPTPMTDEGRRIHNKYIKGKVAPEVDMSSHASHAERRFDWGRAEAGTSGDRTLTESAKGYKNTTPEAFRFRTNALLKEGEKILKEIEPPASGTKRPHDYPKYKSPDLGYTADAVAKHKENLKDPLKLQEDQNKFLKKVKKLRGQGGYIDPKLLKTIGKIGGITALSVALEHFIPNNPLSESRRRGYKLWQEIGESDLLKDMTGLSFDGDVDKNVAGIANPYMRAGASVGQGLLVDTLATVFGGAGMLGDTIYAGISGKKLTQKGKSGIKNRFKKGMLD